MTDRKIGDKIRVTYETTIREEHGYYSGRHLEKNSHVTNHTVEVIESAAVRAADYPTGVITQRPGYVPFIKVGSNAWASVGGSRSLYTDYEMDERAYLKEDKIIGTVPGTPAAEAQKPREFTLDGPEPPADVVALRLAAEVPFGHLVRSTDGWSLQRDPFNVDADEGDSWSYWQTRTRGLSWLRGMLTEVPAA